MTQDILEKVDPRVQHAISAVLRKRFGDYGFRNAHVEAGLDHDGDPILLIDAYYDFSKRPVDTSAMLGLTRALREVLQTLGETRFPHVRHQFDDRQKVVRET